MAKKKEQRVPVSERALIARINRKLRADDEMLKTTRSKRAEFDLGRYYVIDVRGPNIVHDHIDLEDYGRELEVLKPYEALSDGGS